LCDNDDPAIDPDVADASWRSQRAEARGFFLGLRQETEKAPACRGLLGSWISRGRVDALGCWNAKAVALGGEPPLVSAYVALSRVRYARTAIETLRQTADPTTK
jgi:hypothetical protein